MSDLGKALCDGLASTLSDHDKAKRFFENLAQLRDVFNVNQKRMYFVLTGVSDIGKVVMKNGRSPSSSGRQRTSDGSAPWSWLNSRERATL